MKSFPISEKIEESKMMIGSKFSVGDCVVNKTHPAQSGRVTTVEWIPELEGYGYTVEWKCGEDGLIGEAEINERLKAGTWPPSCTACGRFVK